MSTELEVNSQGNHRGMHPNSNHNGGKIFSEETRAKMSKSRAGRFVGKNSPRSKSMVQIDMYSGMVIDEFISGKEAYEETGIFAGGISQAANPDNSRSSAGGYFWRKGDSVDLFKRDNERYIKVPEREGVSRDTDEISRKIINWDGIVLPLNKRIENIEKGI